MIVRKYEESDLDKCLEMARKFFDTTPLSAHMELDLDSVKALIAAEIWEDECLVLVAEHDSKAIGCIGATISPCPFNLEKKIVSELFWYVEPGYRKTGAGQALKAEVEKWAKSNGATIMIMVAIEGPKCNAVRRIYERSGYTNTEHIYLKEI